MSYACTNLTIQRKNCGRCANCVFVRTTAVRIWTNRPVGESPEPLGFALAEATGLPMEECHRRIKSVASRVWRAQSEAAGHDDENEEADYTIRPNQCPKCFLSDGHVCMEAPPLVGSPMAAFQRPEHA